MNKKFIKYIVAVCMAAFTYSKVCSQDQARLSLQNIEKTYLNTQVLAFDGNIKYYTDVQNTSPAEVMTMSYKREGEKVHIVIGEQVVVYDGTLNVVINEDQKIIYVSTKKPDKKNSILPTGTFESYVNSGQFNIQVSDYLGNKKKMSISAGDKSSASTIEFIYQPTTNFIEFTRMIVDREDEDLDQDLNKKKLECSYYNYKTTLDEKIDISKYVTKLKTGKKIQYKGLGKFKDFEVIII